MLTLRPELIAEIADILPTIRNSAISNHPAFRRPRDNRPVLYDPPLPNSRLSQRTHRHCCLKRRSVRYAEGEFSKRFIQLLDGLIGLIEGHYWWCVTRLQFSYLGWNMVIATHADREHKLSKVLRKKWVTRKEHIDNR
jgi:hypothetical protein